MNRRIGFALNDFATVPDTLSDISGDVRVFLKRLFHHMYLDQYEASPPNPNPFFSTYHRHITGDAFLKFTENGLGSHKEARNNESRRFGKAFCRWFLSRYCGVTHYAHIDNILGSRTNQLFRKVEVTRSSRGDLPDYLCSRSIRGQTPNIYLAEAKGRQSQISFSNADFDKWRKQLQTVDVTASNGRKLQVKGFVVCTQLRRERASGNWNSKVFCEDPKTSGNEPNGEEVDEFALAISHYHYAFVLQKLGLSLEADSLLNGYSLGSERRVVLAQWRVLTPPLDGQEFFGVWFPGNQCVTTFFLPQFYTRMPELLFDRALWRQFEIAFNEGVVFGLRVDLCKDILNLTRKDVAQRTVIDTDPITDDRQFDEQIDGSEVLSYLDDGTLIAQATAVEFLDVVKV